MYPPEQHGPNAGSSTGLKIAVGILSGIILFLVIGSIGLSIGYWWGFKSAQDQNVSVAVTGPPGQMPAANATPTATQPPTPTPTPEYAGKYTGSTGQVEISDVTDKGFSFGIGVGNERGSGSIDGKASWTTPTAATFSQIPDQELYDDPESSFYKKKCKLTFRFAGGKLRVSEDDFACTYWHGVAVDFEGTFTKKK